MEKAIFAAGCFWGVQFYFDQVPGVVSTRAGYAGGHTDNPTYEAVCTGKTGHAEAVEVMFNPQVVSYEILVKHFFRMHDPTQLNRQGPDIGTQYRSEIWTENDEQAQIANRVKREQQTHHKRPIVTEIWPADVFYEAEAYHQKYAEKTGQGMCHIPYRPI